MPNLNQIYALKKEFAQLSEVDIRTQEFVEKSEARNLIEKAFSPERLNEIATDIRLFSFINENLNPDKPELIKYFDEGKEEDVALLFIDITSFSKTISGWTNAQIKKYLDDYYKQVIPIIYDNGGEIEKLMGDGVICVFGKPFLKVESPEYVYKAELCAEEVIKSFYNTDKNVKVAIHNGTIRYYKVPGTQYGEYTMIGQSITDLYRLESVSESNAINFFGNSAYDKLGWKYSIFDNTTVHCLGCEIERPQGVDYTQLKYMQFPDYR